VLIRALLTVLCLLVAGPALAQSGIGSNSSGSVCRYNLILPSLGSGLGSIPQCDSSGILLSDVNHIGSGAAVDGWNVTAGAKADTVCATATSTCSEIALLKFISNAVTGPIPAGSAAIGTVNPSTAANWAISTSNGTLPSIGYGGAQARSSEASAVTSGNLVGLSADLVGRQIIFPFANKENLVQGTTSLSGSSSTSLISAPGSGAYIYVTDIACSNTTGANAATVLLQNGSSGTTIWQFEVAATVGAGFTKSFNTPIGGVNNMTVNTALYVQAAAGIACNANGFKGT
jgi:hypothetical protein